MSHSTGYSVPLNRIQSVAAHAEKSESRYTRRTGILDLDFAKDGRLVTAGRDRALRLWNTDGSKISDYPGLETLPTRAAFSVDGSLIFSGDMQGTLWIWNGKSLKPIEQIVAGKARLAIR